MADMLMETEWQGNKGVLSAMTFKEDGLRELWSITLMVVHMFSEIKEPHPH